MNKWQISGKAGKNSETRYTASGKAITEFSLALSEGTKEKPVTTWVKCTVWGEIFIGKGQTVLVDGYYQAHEYEAKDGSKRLDVRCVANSYNVWIWPPRVPVSQTPTDNDFVPEEDIEL